MIRFAVLWAFFLSASATFAGRAEGGGRPELGDAVSLARAELARVEGALARAPRGSDSDSGLRLQRLRLLHTLSVSEEDLLPRAREALAAARRGSDQPDKPLWLAYAGALEVVEARHGFWPKERMAPLQRGLPLLDSAVGEAPEDVEIRYLRLTSCYYLPFFLGRKRSVKEDFRVLAEELPGQADRFPARWYLAITGFVLEKGELDARRRDRLRKARDEAAREHAKVVLR